MRYGKLALLGFLMLNLAGSALAQQQGQNQFRSWIQDQREALASFTHFEVEASTRHRVESGNNSREAQAQLKFSGDPFQPIGQPDILSFVLNGDTLDTTGGRRVQQGLSSMMSPEIGPLLYGFMVPVLSTNQMRPLGGPIPETVDGEKLIRFNFMVDNDPRGPGFLDDRASTLGSPRPGDVGRPPLDPRDRRPGVQRPGARRPGAQRPGVQAPGNQRLGEGRPIERASIWFHAETNQLVMSRRELRLPGDRTLVVESRFERVSGVDVPVWRTIKGSFTMQRRLRSTTAKLEHESYYSGYTFN